jgi:hypothetical protein
MSRKTPSRLGEADSGSPTVGTNSSKAAPSSGAAALRQERQLMHIPSKPAAPSMPEDKAPPLAAFKNSMRAWQARYKARLAGLAAVFGTAHKPTTPA